MGVPGWPWVFKLYSLGEMGYCLPQIHMELLEANSGGLVMVSGSHLYSGRVESLWQKPRVSTKPKRFTAWPFAEKVCQTFRMRLGRSSESGVLSAPLPFGKLSRRRFSLWDFLVLFFQGHEVFKLVATIPTTSKTKMIIIEWHCPSPPFISADKATPHIRIAPSKVGGRCCVVCGTEMSRNRQAYYQLQEIWNPTCSSLHSLFAGKP